MYSEVRRSTGLAYYDCRFVEGYAELAAPLTARTPAPRGVRGPQAHASLMAAEAAERIYPVHVLEMLVVVHHRQQLVLE